MQIDVFIPPRLTTDQTIAKRASCPHLRAEARAT
jgi:hypothetical protein